ncbi:uncharacterized protein BDV14DRAFT_196856 [Aspergillus stella-maris]|uniref:uncharacterized protein n=1 Tax=Aspergillus stella-maris TaxID=1810926 RepID=UPI003CCDE6C7
MPFEFINNNAAIDRTARKCIRTHAATGKNTNRALKRTSKVAALKASTAKPFHTPETIQRARETTNSIASSGTEVVGVEQPLSDGLHFPMPVPVRSRGLVKEALFFFCNVRHSPELDGALQSPDLVSSIWVRFFFVDAAYFHCSIATSIICSKSLVSETAQAMHHIARTYRIIQQRLLGGKEATSDMTIAILVAMSQYERLQGQYERGYVHVQGLRRMIELRGGIRQFNRESAGVAQKVLRADLEYALQLGGTTLLGLEGIEFLRSSQRLITDYKRSIPELETYLQRRLGYDLCKVFADTKGLAGLLNNADAGYSQKLGSIEFYNTILLLGHCLLQINPLCSSFNHDEHVTPSMSALEDVIHLGLLAFLVTFLPGLNHRIADQPILAQSLRHATERQLKSMKAGVGDMPKKSVLLWALLIGAVAVFKPSDDDWLIKTTASTIKALELSTLDDIKQAIIGFPWVYALHDRTITMLFSTQRVYDSITRTSDS